MQHYNTYYIIGIYTSDSSEDDQHLFVTEMHAFSDLLTGLNTPCSCGMSLHPWTVESVIQVLWNTCIVYHCVMFYYMYM